MSATAMDPAGLKRIPEKGVDLRTIRYLATVDVDRAALEERWEAPEIVRDCLAEWYCFAFSPSEGEAFFLQQEVENPPAPGFGLSATRALFSADSAGRMVGALGIAGARVTHVNAEADP
ncbi:hypothetical protein [Streptomyces sp. CAU 1734]|uniref:hypothetical protein n=1 Tax=Streptomyces sp. CAU 1734 TaxID=3140360 RepID=UPI003261BC51